MDIERIYVEQGSEEWLALRKGKFTASMAPAVVGESKFKPNGLRQMWQWWHGHLKIEFSDEFAAHGHLYEPAASAVSNFHASEVVGESVTTEPAVFIRHDLLDGRLMASLDGWNESRRLIGEYKCPIIGREKSTTWKWVEEHESIPPWYWAQVVHGYGVTGATQAIFTVYDAETGHGRSAFAFENELASAWEGEVLPAWTAFADYVDNHDLPPGEIDDDKLAAGVARLRELKGEIKQRQNEEKAIKAALIAAAGGEEAWCNGAHIHQVRTKRADTKAAEKAGIEIPTKDTSYWRVDA